MEWSVSSKRDTSICHRDGEVELKKSEPRPDFDSFIRIEYEKCSFLSLKWPVPYKVLLREPTWKWFLMQVCGLHSASDTHWETEMRNGIEWNNPLNAVFFSLSHDCYVSQRSKCACNIRFIGTISWVKGDTKTINTRQTPDSDVRIPWTQPRCNETFSRVFPFANK